MMQRSNSVSFINVGDVVSKSERYTIKDKFDKRVKEEIEAHQGKYIANAKRTIYSFNSQDVEILLCLHDGSIYKTDCFIDYEWLSEMNFDEFKALYKVFLDMGLSEVEPPDNSLHGPVDEVEPETYRAVFGVKGPAGTMVYKGVIVNPPYPIVSDSRRGSSRLKLLAAFTAVAGIGLLVKRLISED